MWMVLQSALVIRVPIWRDCAQHWLILTYCTIITEMLGGERVGSHRVFFRARSLFSLRPWMFFFFFKKKKKLLKPWLQREAQQWSDSAGLLASIWSPRKKRMFHHLFMTPPSGANIDSRERDKANSQKCSKGQSKIKVLLVSSSQKNIHLSLIPVDFLFKLYFPSLSSCRGLALWRQGLGHTSLMRIQ